MFLLMNIVSIIMTNFQHVMLTMIFGYLDSVPLCIHSNQIVEENVFVHLLVVGESL